MPLVNERVPLLDVVFLGSIDVNEILDDISMLLNEPCIIGYRLSNLCARYQFSLAQRVKQRLLGFRNKNLLLLAAASRSLQLCQY